MAASCVAMGFCWASEAAAQSPESFYKGRQIRMVIPSGAGGGYDSYARMLSQHIRRHIPGNPNIVDQNMPGASGMLATNWAASVAPKDGTVIVATYNTLLVEPLFGNPSVKYDPRDLEWIGSISKQQQHAFNLPRCVVVTAIAQQAKRQTSMPGASAWSAVRVGHTGVQ
jgi:tripartite-type tricarboxylate transporter receptor subunit TctC